MKRLLETLTTPVIMCGIAIHTLAAMLATEMVAPDTPGWLRAVDAVCIVAFVVDYWTCWRKRLK